MPRTPSDPDEDVTAEIQADLARMAAEAHRMAERVQEHHDRMTRSHPVAEPAADVPTLARRVRDELPDRAAELREMARSLWSMAERTEDEVLAEWLQELIARLRAEAYAFVSRLRANLSEPAGEDAAEQLRAGAWFLRALAEPIEELLQVAKKTSQPPSAPPS